MVNQTSNQTPSPSGNNNRARNPRTAASNRTPKKQGFQGDAPSDSILYKIVITSGANQSTQIIKLQQKLPTYCANNGYVHWPECITNMTPKVETDFIQTAPNILNYGALDANGNFNFTDFVREQAYGDDRTSWSHRDAINRKAWQKYLDNGAAIFYVIQG